jgi:hypothetical protein
MLYIFCIIAYYFIQYIFRLELLWNKKEVMQRKNPLKSVKILGYVWEGRSIRM